MNDTEKRNQNTLHIDKMSVSQMLETLQTENYNALKAVDRALKSVEKAIVAIEPKMKQGGRLFYVGCGTSGRLGVMDAAECPPTFGIAPDRVTGIIAGGDEALKRAVENYEDDAEKGKEALLGYELSALDCVMGISAAGGAKFVIGALQYAREKGCTTIALTNNIDTPIEKIAQYSIVVTTGPEPITGSTRMKAGTSQKLILNMISTILMIRMGYVYENLMINLRPDNIKLKKRAVSIVKELTGCSDEVASSCLKASHWDLRRAINAVKGQQ